MNHAAMICMQALMVASLLSVALNAAPIPKDGLVLHLDASALSAGVSAVLLEQPIRRYFELGANSLLLAQAHERLCRQHRLPLQLTDLVFGESSAHFCYHILEPCLVGLHNIHVAFNNHGLILSANGFPCSRQSK